MNQVALNPRDLLHRLEALEARSRRRSRWFLLGLTLVSAGVLMGQTLPTEKVVEANRFVLRDEQGRERGRWGVGHDQTVGLVLYDTKQSSRLLFGTAIDGTSRFVVLNREGKVQIQFRLKPTGEARLDLADSEGRRRLRVGLGKDGTPKIDLRDAEGKPLPGKP